ncbi:MAG: pilus assembly protein N-terminal domain-containing protein [Steroidobacter sp.]
MFAQTAAPPPEVEANRVAQEVIKGTPAPRDREQAPMPTVVQPTPPRRSAPTRSVGVQTVNSVVGKEPLAVREGQTLVLRFPNVKRVIAGNGDIVDVKVFEDSSEVVVFGRKAGMTDLRLWSRDGYTETHVVQVAGAIQPPTFVPPLEIESTILLKAKFIEVKRDALKDIGVDWADVATGPIFGTVQEVVTNPYFRVIPETEQGFMNVLPPFDIGTGNNYLSLTTTVDSLIRLLVSNGDARLLAEPTLTCINGGAADFLAGGELPIPIVDNDGRINVQFKEFGIILNIEPQANDDGLIRTKVNVEVSSVDRSISVAGIPGFATRKTKTEMNVQSGQTMVVGGLFSSDDAKTVVKVPGLGNIPIIGELFKSRNFRSGQTELVVLVSPRIISPESKEVRDAEQQFDDLKTKSDEKLKFKLKD